MCPGSARLEHAAGEETEKADAAARGVGLHQVMSGKRSDAELSEWDRTLLERARNYDLPSEPSVYVENVFREHAFLALPLAGIPPDRWPTGTCDFLAIGGYEAWLVDYKFGPLELNQELAQAQLFTYAALALQEFYKLDVIHVRIYHAESDTEFSETVYRSDFPKLKARLREIILACEAPEAPLVPTVEGCRYCGGRALCPAAQQIAKTLIRDAVKLETLTPSARSELLKKAKIAKRYAEAVENAMTKLEREKPGSVPGFKLRERSQRKVENVAGAMARLEPIVSRKQLFAALRLSIGKAEELFTLLYQEQKGGTNKAAKEVFMQVLGELVSYTEPAYWLEQTYDRKEISE